MTAPLATERPTILRHLVLVALLVITTINYVQRNCLGAAATTLEAELDVTPALMDQAISAFFWSYTLMQVPSGWLAKRWGSRVALTVFAAGWSLAMLACGLAVDFTGLYFARVAMGLLQAGIFPCATLILAVWYPASLRGVSTALLNSFMLVGGALGTLLTGLLLAPLGWRWLFILYSLPGLVWSAWFLWWFRNRPQDHPQVNEAERAVIAEGRPRDFDLAAPASEAAGPSRATWLVLATSLPLILLCTQQFCRAGANRLFDSRLPTYVQERLQAGGVGEKDAKREAAVLASWPQWAGVIGGVLGGGISDWVLARTGRRRLARNGVAIVALFACTVLYFGAYWIADLMLATIVLSAGAFVFCFSSPCAYALTIDIGGKNLPIVFGCMNMAGNLGAFLFVSLIMTLVNVGGWELAFTAWLSLHLVAVACWLFLNPEGTIGEPSPKHE